jgi:Fe2+ or Zn2+ uptake regulation protein
MDEQETDEKKQEIKLTRDQIAILKVLDNAPAINKTIYYLSGYYARAYEYMYKKIRVMESLGVLYKHKSDTGKVSYIPKKNVMIAIYERDKLLIDEEDQENGN